MDSNDLELNAYARQLSQEEIDAKEHRNFVGGNWDELGPLQFEFLVQQGLRPNHYLLDVGCGALRGGLHFIHYLDPGHYCGFDINASLIDAAWQELREAGLENRHPRLAVEADFSSARFGQVFDFALAQSVFSHLPINHIVRCLAEMKKTLAPAGVFFATFFEAPGSTHLAQIAYPDFGGFATSYTKDPYHYSFEEFEWMAGVVGLTVERADSYAHPRGQKMLAFRLVDARDQLPREDKLGVGLHPGAAHYRAYVGPPEDYDLVAAMCFGLLTSLGLRGRHRLLDVGCGSLRLGRLLIPYLNEGNYHGLEPNQWLVDDGIAMEIGKDILTIKKPSFYFTDSVGAIGKQGQFDFAIAQSIYSHCGPDLLAKHLLETHEALAAGGALVATFVNGPADAGETGWVYPGCVEYTPAGMAAAAKSAGFDFYMLDWLHPRQSWALFAKPGFDVSWLMGRALSWNSWLQHGPK